MAPSPLPRAVTVNSSVAETKLSSSALMTAPDLVLLPAAAKSLQSCPTLCDPIDGSPPGSPVPGILQARVLEWVAIAFSSAWKWKVKVKSLSRVRLSATPWTAAYQAPPSMGFFQAKVLEWGAIAFSGPASYKMSFPSLSYSSQFAWDLPPSSRHPCVGFGGE